MKKNNANYFLIVLEESLLNSQSKIAECFCLTLLIPYVNLSACDKDPSGIPFLLNISSVENNSENSFFF